MISVIIPSRGRPNELLTSLKSLSLDKHNLEALIWLDSDDPTLNTYLELFRTDPNVKLFVKERVGYKNFHIMLNFLAHEAKYDWIFEFNDDAYIDVNNWFDIFQKFVSEFEPNNQPVVINIWGQGTDIANLFPIVSRAYLNVLEHFAMIPTCDDYVRAVGMGANISYDLLGIKPKHRKYVGDDILIDQTFNDVETDRKNSGRSWNVRHSPGRQLVKSDVQRIAKYLSSPESVKSSGMVKTVGFIGLGKLGLPVAEAVNGKGFNVIGYDVKPVVAKFTIAKSIKEIVEKSDIVFCAVQTPHGPEFEGITPLTPERADFDYSFLLNAISEIAKTDTKTNLVVISTCLPGTFNKKIKPILTDKINYIYNPFFIAMGTVVEDFMNPEFVLIGGENVAILKHFYNKIHGMDKTFVTDITTAEGIKVFYNTFVTTKTVLGNMYGEFAHKLGMNVDHIYSALSRATQRLISPKYLKSGMADGGSCLPKGELVMTKAGMKPIETISIGEQVLTSKGRFKKVLKIWKRKYNGDLVKVTVRGLPVTKMTIEHPVFARLDGRNRTPDGRRNTFHKIINTLSKVEVVRADNLNLDHLIGFPIIVKSSKAALPIPMVELAGWYLSEGSAELSNRRGRLRFDLNAKEVEDGIRISKLLETCAYPKSNNRGSNSKITIMFVENRQSVRFGDINLTKYLVSNFGKGAKNKFIPETILWGDLEQAKLLLKGLIRGDGHRSKNGISYSTISKDLAWGVFVILHRLGLNPTLREIPARGIHKPAFETRIRNRRLASILCKIVDWKPYTYDKNIQTYATDKTGVWRHVQKLGTEHYNGNVYNLWVDEDNSFVTKCGAVHNCHPRDNIALSHLSDTLGMSFNYFDALMTAREKHTEWLAELFVSEIKASKLPAIILGKSFKPETDLVTGSAASLLAHFVSAKKTKFKHYEFDYPKKLPVGVYFIATAHVAYKDLPYPAHSVVIDPFRYIENRKDVKIIAIGKQ